MPTTPEKARLRALAEEARAALSPEERQARTASACARARTVLASAPGIVGAYAAIGEELNPIAMLRQLAAEGRALALPATPTWGQPLVFRAWAPGDRLVRGRMNVPEPPPEAPEVFPAVLLAPPVAFDRRGYRIGYGGGFYDRTLPVLRARHPVLAVGIAFACQECPAVPEEPHDVPLDVLVTEDEVIRPPAASAGPRA